MPESLKLDYLVEARSTLDSYIEDFLIPGAESDSDLLVQSVAFSLLSIADSLATVARRGLGFGGSCSCS